MWALLDGNVCQGDKPRTPNPRIARMWSPEQQCPEMLQRHLQYQAQEIGDMLQTRVPSCKFQ